MPRKHLFQLLSERELNIPTEFHSLHCMFSEENCIDYHSYTMQDYLDYYIFRELPMSGTFLSIQSMRESLGIALDVGRNMNQLFLFCELIYNLIYESRNILAEKVGTARNNEFNKQALSLVKNMTLILDKTGYRWLKLEEDEFIIVENNKVANEAAELVEDEQTALQIMEYNHYALEGDLEAKKRILFAVGQYLEPMLKQRTGTVFDEISDDAKFMLNNLHIRHNNRVGSKANDYIQGVTDKKLEQWYDRTYAALIGAIVMNDWKDTHDEVKKLKAGYQWKQ